MNRRNFILPLVFLLSSCSGNMDTEGMRKDILFSAGTSESVSGDAGLFADLVLKDGSESAFLTNERFSGSDGALVSEKKFVIPEGMAELSVYAYRPYDPDLEDMNRYPFAVPEDQSSDESSAASDFLLASGAADASGHVSLAFRHATSEMVLEVSVLGGESDCGNASVSFLNLPVSAEIDIASGRINVTGSSDVAAHIEEASGSGFSARVSVFPGSLSEGDVLSVIRLGDDRFEIPVPENVEMVSGKRYILKAAVAGEGAEADADFTIEDWTVSEEIDIEPDIDNGQLSVTDIDGNKYPVAQFGDNLWMLKNLRVRNYNDGTPIDYINDENPDVWNGLATGAFCCYNNAEPSSSNDHFLYNFYAAETGKLCPEGWHVPSMEEWTALADEFGGAEVCGAALKSTYGWEDGNGTDESGMGILPVGVMDGWFKQDGKFSYIWTSSYKEDDDTKVHAVYFSYNSDAMKHWSFGASKVRGYSVRCVKSANGK